MQKTMMPYRKQTVILFFAGLLVLGLAGTWLYFTLTKKKPYKIGIILSRTEVPEADWNIIDFMVTKRLQILNSEGGINGRPVQAVYLDDKGDNKKLIKLVQQQIKDDNLVALIGAQGVSRALALGPLLTREKVPFIGNYIYSQHTRQFPTMYTSGFGIKESSLIFAELLRTKATKLGFIGKQGALQSTAFLKILQTRLMRETGIELTFQRFYPEDHKLSPTEMKVLADSLRNKVDFLVYTGDIKSIYQVLEALDKHQVRIPVFCGLIDIAQLDASNQYIQATEFYDLTTVGIPGAHNIRLHEKLTLFRNGMDRLPHQDYQLGLAGNLTDIIGLVTEAARDTAISDKNPIRTKINKGLRKYLNGQKIYKGWFSDLYFTVDRAFAGNILLAWKPRNRLLPVLAPMQYLVSNNRLKPAQVLFTSLDMVEVDQVNDEEGTFQASFYMQLQSEQEFDLAQLDFTNAARNSINHEPLLDARLIRSRKDSTGFKFYHYLYKISGKFHFEPDLHQYPLDEQAFPISIQASNALKPFFIQPSSQANRDTIFETNGWSYQNQFIGFDQEIISSFNALTLGRKNIPFYKFTFVYTLKRTSIDYFLKTLMPLFTILTIAYFSVYIPPREFEALAGIQVTALLSSIALYFSTYKPLIQYATISDKIFIFSYVLVTTLIGTSILIYLLHHKHKTLKRITQVYQRILFPLIVIGFSIYIRWF